MNKPLSERRAADRKKMALEVIRLAQQCGAVVEPTFGPLECTVYIRAARGLCVRVEFESKSCQPDVHVLSWHMDMDADTDAELNDATFGGNVNPYHRHKATYVGYGFDDMCCKLRFGLGLAASGEAFLSQEAVQKHRDAKAALAPKRHLLPA